MEKIPQKQEKQGEKIYRAEDQKKVRLGLGNVRQAALVKPERKDGCHQKQIGVSHHGIGTFFRGFSAFFHGSTVLSQTLYPSEAQIAMKKRTARDLQCVFFNQKENESAAQIGFFDLVAVGKLLTGAGEGDLVGHHHALDGGAALEHPVGERGGYGVLVRNFEE